jgi:UDP-N-acetylmuramyl pentapeptide phosphotransferase/UDP-N-acetylglucosamine-1-phosphate transferase
MLTLILSFLMSFALVFAITPSVIRIARKKGLVADPVGRSSHKVSTPCIGGIPIFIGILFTSMLLTPHDNWAELQFILSAMVIVFMVGTKDDIEGLSPRHKMIGLVVAISILISRGDVQLHSMYGLFGSETVFPDWLSLLISGFTLLVVTNAFNLIDGINGLSGVVGTICSVTFGTYFFMVDETYLGVLSMTTAGSLIAFLRFNVSPARTFMGDTGALVVGLLLGVMVIKFIDISSSGLIEPKFRFVNPIAVAVSILIIPLFDTIRVFTTRILRGHSPFQPDRRHIHHLLIDSGLDHMQATTVLGLANMLFISTVFFLDDMLDLHSLVALQIGVALLATFFLHRNVRQINARKLAMAKQTAGEVQTESA